MRECCQAHLVGVRVLWATVVVRVFEGTSVHCFDCFSFHARGLDSIASSMLMTSVDFAKPLPVVRVWKLVGFACSSSACR